MSRVTYTRQRRTELTNYDLFAGQIAERAEQIHDERWPEVHDGLLLPIVVEDLFAVYVAKQGVDDKLTRMDRKFAIFRRKLIRSWREWLITNWRERNFAVNKMMHDLLDESVDGYEKFRVTRERVNNAKAEKVDSPC